MAEDPHIQLLHQKRTLERWAGRPDVGNLMSFATSLIPSRQERFRLFFWIATRGGSARSRREGLQEM